MLVGEWLNRHGLVLILKAAVNHYSFADMWKVHLVNMSSIASVLNGKTAGYPRSILKVISPGR